MKRRHVLQLGILSTGIAGVPALGKVLTPPLPGTALRPAKTIAIDLFDSLSGELKDIFVVDYDHPLRQYHNRGVWAGGAGIGKVDFSETQLALITELMYSGMSAEGRTIIPDQYYLTTQGLTTNNLLICGNPHDGDCQVIFSGPHLALRLGGKNREGVAFGGPQIYGDQRGNKEPGLPDNIYRSHLSLGMNLFHSLNESQRLDAVIETSPIQTQIEVQGSAGQFPGIPVAATSEQSQSMVRELINLTLKSYAIDDVAYAWQCIDDNGGIDSLHLSFYADSTYDGEVLYQTYRLEGPASVFYFRGFPHVHAFFNVAMDGENPLSVGEIVGRNETLLEGLRLKSLFEKAMVAEGKTDFAYYPLDSVVGKIRPGTIRTGDLYNAESWQNNVAQIAVTGNELGGDFREQLDKTGIDVQPERIYSITTIDYLANEALKETFGNAKLVSVGSPLRDQFINYVRKNGFS